MMNTELERLRKEIEKKMQKELRSPNDFNELSLKVKLTTGNDISLSTIKRLWGYVKSAHNPRFTTLSVLSRYLGYEDWTDFCSRKAQE